MRSLRRLFTLGALAALVAVPASLPALAQAGTATKITHRQSVLTELSPTGEPGVSRVFTQLTVEGNGAVEVALPNQSTSGLRNLEGFGRPRTDGDTVIWDLVATPDGTFRRTVANADASQLPVSISVGYRLDGQPIEPEDLVGRSGRVEVTFTLRNLTVEEQELRFFDGLQEPRFETAEVAVPMVGSVSSTLDGRFVDVSAPGGVTAGDGRGNTVVNWSVVLFEPIGAHEAELSYSAQVVDAIVPEASVQILPVDSNSFASLRGAQDSFGDAVGSLRTITTQTLLIDSNLGLLGAGAGDLLDGLIQLRDGAAQLEDGLANTAAPGAAQLAEGTGQASDGSRQLADGLGELASGAGQLSDGLGQARSGSGELSDGLGQLASGAGELDAGAQQIAGGLAEVDRNLAQLAAGAAQLADGLEQIAAGTSTGFPGAIEGLPQLAAGAGALRDNVYAGIGTSCAPGTDGCGLVASLQTQSQLLTTVSGAIAQTCADPEVDVPVCDPAVQFSISVAKDIVDGAVGNLSANQGQINELVGGAEALAGQLAPALQDLADAFGSPDAPGPVLGGAQQVAEGAAMLREVGIQPLAAGASQLAAGTSQLAAGAGTAASGSGDLASGLVQLDDGGRQLADGAGQAASGANDLAAGLVQIDDGANQLAGGLGDAADGAGQLAEGLAAAADGGGQIAEGTGALSEQGLQALAEGVSDGAAGTALTLEIANAADQRGRDLEGLVYGTPDGAEATAVYQFEIAGVGGEEGPSGATRGIVAVIGFALAGALGMAVRSRFA